jgi:AcrR family transcriptional regulator
MPDPAPRADVARNRERILIAARAALAETSDASLSSIAKAAGVGFGTLYRHFPTREALVLALYHREMQHLAGLAPELLRDHEPLGALRLWLQEVARYGRLKYGAAEVIHAATGNGASDPNYAPFLAAITMLLDAGASSGALKRDLDPEDVLLQMGVLWRIPPAPDAEARAARLLNLIIDGLLAR